MRTTKSRSEALARTIAYNKQGLSVSISYLPIPSVTSKAVEQTIAEYRLLLSDINEHKLNADVTVKPQQFGTSIGNQTAIDALGKVITMANEKNIRVWLDQELATQTNVMHAAGLASGPKQVGLCIQAFRQRSVSDVKKLAGFPIRLVKGFYKDYDISPWSAVTENYYHLMDDVAKQSPYPCFATHDLHLIEKAKIILADKKDSGEIQFFAGVRDDLVIALAQEGYQVRIYLPYGNVYAFLWYGLPIFDRVRALKRLLGYKVIT